MKRLVRIPSLFLLLAALNGAALAEPVPSDNFDEAIDLAGQSTASSEGTLTGATAEDGEPYLDGWSDGEFFYPNEVSCWWTWTCPAGGDRLVTLSTAGSTGEFWDYDPGLDDFVLKTGPLDTTLYVFTGTQLPDIVPVAESRDGAADGTSLIRFIATGGATYHIRVSGEEMLSSDDNVVKLGLTTQTTPATADDHVAWGKAKLLIKGDWLGYDTPYFETAVLDAATAHFQQAKTLSKAHLEANVLSALVDLLKLQKEAPFSALLTSLGVQDASDNAEYPDYYVPEDENGHPLFADGALTTAGIEFFKGPVRSRVAAALATLEKITATTVLGAFPEHARLIDEPMLIDYGDTLLLRGGCKTLLALIDFLETYNLAASLNQVVDLERAGTLDAETLTNTFGNLLQFSGSDKRAGVKANLQGAIALYDKARTYIRANRPLSRDENHLFPLRGMDAEEDTDIKSTLDKINKSLGGTTITEEGWSVNLGKLLTGTLSLRALSPNFKGDQVIKGSLANPTFNDALPGTTAAKLEAELLEDEMLYEGLLQVNVMVADGQDAWGDFTGGGEFLAGTLVNPPLTATRSPGYVFKGWNLDEGFVSSLSPYVFPVIRDYTLVAHFEQDKGDDDKDGLSNHAEVQLGIFNLLDADSDDDGWPDGLDPDPINADSWLFAVSQSFADLPLALSTGEIIAFSGLPPGVTFDAKNKRFVGRPKAVKGTQQTFAAVATVKPASGANFKITVTFVVEALPAGMAGAFNGLINADGLLNNDLGGSVTATVSVAGMVTGKAILAGKSTGFGPINLNTLPGASTATVTLPAIKRAGLPDLFIDLTVSSADQELYGAMGISRPEQVLFTSRRVHFSSANKATALKGLYNAALTPNPAEVAEDNLSFPQGTGYLTLKVTETGGATWGGKLADGTTVTGGTALASGGVLPFHLMLYGNTGSAQGWAQANNGLLAGLEPVAWLKKQQPDKSTTRSYKAGFARHGLALNGGLWTLPANVAVTLGLDAVANNATAVFNLEGIASVNHTFTLTAPNSVTIPANAQKVKLTLAPGTGVVSGSFTVPGTPARTATVNGAVIPGAGTCVGYFLVPETAATNAPILSGKMTVSASD